MADYKELLRRAVEALPENNGAARRAVYEKARAALVGQLRAINPPLPARDITTHRLQLEDCIRQVEQEASEAVIAGMGSQPALEPPPPPVYFEPPNTQRTPPALAKPQSPQRQGAPAAKQGSKPTLVGGRDAPRPMPAGGTIEDIIAAANAESPAPAPRKGRPGSKADKPAPVRLASPPEQDEDEDAAAAEPDILPPRPQAKTAPRTLPAIVARAEAAKNRSNSTAFSVPGGDKPYDSPRRGPSIEPRRDGLMPAARGGQAAVARQPVVEPVAFLSEPKVAAAMSAVREVEVEAQPVDPQGAIDRAIATLDREARGEADAMVNGAANDIDEEVPNGKARGGFAAMMPGARRNNSSGRPQQRQMALPPPAAPEPAYTPNARRGRTPEPRYAADAGFPRARPERERRGMGAISIFLIVFAVLLAGVGGAGFWAASQGFLDVQAMLNGGAASTGDEAAPAAAAVVTADVAPATGPGNTTEPEAALAPATELTADERLGATPATAPTGAEPLALVATEDRLTAEAPATADNGATAALDSASIAGAQSLLLEASEDGPTGAVPFSGTIEWTQGKDETGLPVLIGKASIPARNLGVEVLIRKNSDSTLPATHLMEINFQVNETFVGGSVAGLPGVLLKNEELVQGIPLVGASARVVGNSFLFALSALPEALAANTALLTDRKYIDIALIYATGRKAIITLEKDDAATAMFRDVFAAWGQTASN